MNRNRGRVFWTIITLVLALCVCCVLVGCEPDEPQTNGGEQTVTPPDDGIAKVEYKVTVLSPDGAPLEGVEVQLFLLGEDDEPYSGATTGNDGIARILTGQGLEYIIVLKRLPADYIYNDEVIIESDESEKSIRLEPASTDNSYKLTVITEGGMVMSGIDVTIKDGDTVIAEKTTDAFGLVSIKVSELKEYSIVLEGLPDGYSLVESNPTTSATGGSQNILVTSAPIKADLPANHRYTMDDIIYDFSVTTSDGKTFTLSEVLEEKSFVMINFWATWCGPCKAEFEGMQKAYERCSDDMAIIAMSTDDTLVEVAEFKSGYSPVLTFDMAVDENNLYEAFVAYGGGGIPLSILVDKYGKISNYIFGGGTEAWFKQEFDRYTSPDYVQVKYDPDNDNMPADEGDKPDIEMPDSKKIVEAINKGGLTGTYSAENDGKIWPWTLGKDGEDNILYAGNITHNNTSSSVSYKFRIDGGQFLTFDYKTNTEDISGADVLTVYIDGGKVAELDRLTDGEWKTCYIYTPLSDELDAEDKNREHTMTLLYEKDSSDGAYLQGTEVVAIKDMRTTAVANISGDVNLLREASWNYDDTEKRWKNYITPVYNEQDGYYHVGSVDGPYLLANLGGETHYSNYSMTLYSSSGLLTTAGVDSMRKFISTGLSKTIDNCYVEENKSYGWFAMNSNTPNYCIVDKTLKSVLDTIVEALYDTTYQGDRLGRYYDENTWLELCGYYENYSGEGIGNPLTGLGRKEAIPAQSGTATAPVANHVVVDRTLVPRGVVYKFDCTVTGAYRIYSERPVAIQNKQSAYVQIEGPGVDKGEDAYGDFNQYVGFKAGETYYISVAFDLPSSWGEMDFFIEYIAASADNFTYAADGTYTWLIDENDNPVYDENGEIVFIVNRNNDLHAALGKDGKYHQILSDGTVDNGDKSYIWINLNAESNLFNCSLKDLATNVRIDGYAYKFFDFSNEGGQDYSKLILDYCAKADTTGDTAGMIIANEELVEIITKALVRIGHDEEDAWLGLSYYYEHLGEYTLDTETVAE